MKGNTKRKTATNKTKEKLTITTKTKRNKEEKQSTIPEEQFPCHRQRNCMVSRK